MYTNWLLSFVPHIVDNSAFSIYPLGPITFSIFIVTFSGANKLFLAAASAEPEV